uniref:Guanylyl cyclase n=1 Tax=Chrysotila carterae TaxID=13221 RepID=A0A7S4B0T1_CHRCT|mmetsp:Transcript_29912/g.63041  ORF Transcript_29912/g.63041 Transcript_29912/m.63041 type:complete len:293 (+) Transcript_29912:424-1302(+)
MVNICRGTTLKRQIPHVRQSFNWDCGFACLEMALRALGVSQKDCSLQQLRSRVPSSSIWTVDLAHVLRDYGVRFRFLTAMPGVNPAYQHEAFYKPTIDSDSERVLRLFEKAAERDISIERASLSSQQLQELVVSDVNIVMVLVDRRRLYRSAGDSINGLVESLSQCIVGSYVGHYVLITGYNEGRAEYNLMDPARSGDELSVRADDLNAARLSHGTDEDIIVIPWDQHALPNANAARADGDASLSHCSERGVLKRDAEARAKHADKHAESELGCGIERDASSASSAAARTGG